MRLYLVQHGTAKSKAEHPERPLTQQGREDVARVAAFSQSAGVDVFQIRHSSKLRAKETAVILAEHLSPVGGVLALPGLAPRDDVRPLAELLNREAKSLMFVGHRPFMDRLAGRLVAKDEDCRVVEFRKGGVVCLDRDVRSATWSVLWAITPNVIPQADPRAETGQ